MRRLNGKTWAKWREEEGKAGKINNKTSMHIYPGFSVFSSDSHLVRNSTEHSSKLYLLNEIKAELGQLWAFTTV